MLENLLFSLNRVMPYFLLIVLGGFLCKSGMVPQQFFAGANRFTFKIALPLHLFRTIASVELNGQGGWFMLYVLEVTLVSFFVIWIVTELIYKDKALVGTLVQGAFRSNFVLFGAPLAGSVLGEGAVKTAALAAVALVPTYSVLSVLVLTIRGKAKEKQTFKSLMKKIFSTPLMIVIMCATPLMLLQIKLPSVIEQTVASVGGTSTPLGLLSIGGMLNMSDATARIRPALYSSLIKVLLLPIGITTASYFAGYRGNEMLCMFLISAAPMSISAYTMAVEMGGDAALASNISIITTLASAFVLALGIYLLKTFSLI